MGFTPFTDSNAAPLAFALSIKTERVMPALRANQISLEHTVLYGPFLALAIGGAVGSGLIYMNAYEFVGYAAGAAAAYFSLKPLKRYFGSGYIEKAVKANRVVLAKYLSSIDANLLASVTAGILTSHYGKEKWPTHPLVTGAGNDPFSYLAAVFVFAPEAWTHAARYVYQRTLSGVIPTHAATA